MGPTEFPTGFPSGEPTESPIGAPTLKPTRSPLKDGKTHEPTTSPTEFPTGSPTAPVSYYHCINGWKLTCYTIDTSCHGKSCGGNWKYWDDSWEGFMGYCADWNANNGVFNGGKGPCTTKDPTEFPTGFPTLKPTGSPTKPGETHSPTRARPSFRRGRQPRHSRLAHQR